MGVIRGSPLRLEEVLVGVNFALTLIGEISPFPPSPTIPVSARQPVMTVELHLANIFSNSSFWIRFWVFDAFWSFLMRF